MDQGYSTSMPLRWLVGIIIVAALLVGGIWYRNTHLKNSNNPNQPAVTKAAAGTVTSAMPKALLPEEGIKPEESYSINYQSGVKLAQASYSSAKSVSENITLFRAALAKDGWSILKDPNPKGGLPASFYAKKGSADVTIIFSDNGGKVQVHIVYTTRP